MGYPVTAPNSDFRGTREGVDVRDGEGVAETDVQARNLARRGFKVAGLAAAADDKPLSEMRKAELEAVAQAEGVDLSEAKNNGDRVKAIEAAREAAAASDDGDTDDDDDAPSE